MSLYGVFGNPVKHSLSPIIHTQFGKQTGIEINYEKILAPIDNFAFSAKKFINQGANGFNVTTPFKLDAFALATQLTANAKIAGAVNTIKIDNNEIIGENTDGIGLVNDLSTNLTIDLKNKEVLILGAGGAARGILMPLLQQQTKIIMIANRSAAKAIKLAKEFSPYGQTCGFGLDKIKPRPVDIIINATSAALDNQMPNINNKVANKAVCYELMYGQKTPFMQWAQNNNAAIIADGLGMLVEQAASSFEFWTNIKPDTQKTLEYMKKFIL